MEAAFPWSRVLKELESYYSTGVWRTPVLRERGADPFLVLVSTVLSHRTRDEVTEHATVRVLAEYPTPEALSRASVKSIEVLIHKVGLSKSKARGLREAARVVVSRHGGIVPASEAELLQIPMIGPKTAHAIRVFGYRKPGLPVDTHILRVTRRLGVVQGRTISEAQRELSRVIPRKYWGLVNPILVQHGQNLCRATRPQCGDCPISRWCQRIGVSEGFQGRALIG